MTEERSANPGVWFPPPFLFVVGFLVALALDRWMFSLRLGDTSRPAFVVVGWLLIVGGMFVVFWAMLTFARARTAILPSRPARTIVVSGPFRYSRNPMYIGLSSIYLGLSLLMNIAWPIVLLPLVLLSLYALVIRREELYLGNAFGEQYAAYRRRVRRWL